jgi:hypothetical protein
MTIKMLKSQNKIRKKLKYPLTLLDTKKCLKMHTIINQNNNIQPINLSKIIFIFAEANVVKFFCLRSGPEI